MDLLGKLKRLDIFASRESCHHQTYTGKMAYVLLQTYEFFFGL